MLTHRFWYSWLVRLAEGIFSRNWWLACQRQRFTLLIYCSHTKVVVMTFNQVIHSERNKRDYDNKLQYTTIRSNQRITHCLYSTVCTMTYTNYAIKKMSPELPNLVIWHTCLVLFMILPYRCASGITNRNPSHVFCVQFFHCIMSNFRTSIIFRWTPVKGARWLCNILWFQWTFRRLWNIWNTYNWM